MEHYLRKIYSQNSFVNLLEMKLAHMEPGKSELTMPVDPAKHTNLYNVAHGGALASLADTAMGVACATLGRRVVTLELNMNFIKAPEPGTTIRGLGRVVHNGSRTLVVECEILGAADVLLGKARGTFFVAGKFDIVQEV